MDINNLSTFTDNEIREIIEDGLLSFDVYPLLKRRTPPLPPLSPAVRAKALLRKTPIQIRDITEKANMDTRGDYLKKREALVDEYDNIMKGSQMKRINTRISNILSKIQNQEDLIESIKEIDPTGFKEIEELEIVLNNLKNDYNKALQILKISSRKSEEAKKYPNRNSYVNTILHLKHGYDRKLLLDIGFTRQQLVNRGY